MSRLRLAALPALLVLAGCGGSSSSEVASKSPQQLLADMRSALASVKSYHLQGSFTDKDGDTSLAGDVAAPDSLRLTLDQAGKTAAIVVAGGKTYLRANRAFWIAQGGVSQPKVIKLLADRWVKVPQSSAGDLRNLVGEFTPGNLGHCLSTDVGTVTKRGTSTLDGKNVVVLVDKGDKPGTSPGELYLAASGPTLPLRLRQTGPDRPGGRHDPRCGSSGSSTTKGGDARFTRFDEPVKITAPPGALDLGRLAGGSSTA